MPAGEAPPERGLNHTTILQATADHGFIGANTVAAALHMQERLILALLERLGNEVHLNEFGCTLDGPPERRLEAEFNEVDATFIVRAVEF